MNTQSRIVQSHAFLFRDGDAFTLPAPGVAGRAAKPDAADPAWIDLGIVSGLSFNPTQDEKEIYRPSPGHLELEDVLTTKRKLAIKFDCEELSFMSFELAFRTDPLSTAAALQYNPDSAPELKGWLKVQNYDQNDNLINTVDVYCYLKLGGELKFDDNVVKTSIEGLKLRSDQNTGLLA